MTLANFPLTDRSTSSLTTSSAQVLAANVSRNVLIIFNPSLVYSVAISLSGTAAVIGGAGSITIPAGQAYSFESNTVPSNAINAISENASTTKLTIWEG